MKLPGRVIGYITLLVYWGPSNALFYFWGFILFFTLVLFKKDWLKTSGSFSKKIINNIIIFYVLFLTSSLINYWSFGVSFNNFVWSVITFGSSFFALFAILLIPFQQQDLEKIFRFSLYLTLFQIFLGYLQMLKFQGFTNINPFSVGIDAGDFFVGTTFDPGIGNMVAIKVSLMTLLFVPIWFSNKTLKNSLILGLLFLGWVLASAIYTLLIGMIVIIFVFVIKRIWKAIYTLKMNKSIFYITVLSMFSVVIFIYTQRDNVTYMIESLKAIHGTVVNRDVGEPSRKILYYKQTLTELPFDYPGTTLIGVGPGNYSSRSAWLVSGEYLSHQPKYIPVTPSPIAQKYTLSLWSKNMIAEGFKGAGSITNQPFSTWFSVFAEIGIIALLIFGRIFYTLHKAFLHQMKNPIDPFTQNLALGMEVSLAYIAILFFVDNLFEWPLVMGQFFLFAGVLIRVTENELKKSYMELPKPV